MSENPNLTVPIRINNVTTESGTKAIANGITKAGDVFNQTDKFHTTSKGIKPTKRLKFPSDIDSDTSFGWIKYEIHKFLPISSATSGTTHRGNSHFGVTVSKEIVAEIALPIQSQMEVTEKQKWKQEAAGGMIDQLVQKSKGGLVAGGPGGAVSAVASGSENLVQGVGDAITKNISNGTSLTGTVITDKLALKYDGPDGVRSFSMSHKFVPRSRKESSDIRDIIKLFRMSSAPSLHGEENEKDKSSFYTSYKFPHLFKVMRMAGKNVNSNYPQYDLCYCSNVSVKYGDESGTAFVADDSPISFELTLSFEEIAVQNREQIENGGF
jgi:hypothetical protein